MDHSISQQVNKTLPQPPMFRHTPVLGHTLDMARDPLQLFVRGYTELGPVFRVKALTRTFFVIAGPEAFEFVAQGGETNVSAGPAIGATTTEIGARRSLITVEGEAHAHMRKAQRVGYSRSAFLEGAPKAIARTMQRLQTWQVGKTIDIFPELQRLIMEQLALALVGEEANDYFDDVRIYIGTILNVYVHGLAPKWVMKLPRFLQAKRRFVEIGNHIVSNRRAGLSPTRNDLIDDALAYKDIHGEKLDDHELVMAAMSPFIAGMDTAAAMASFLLFDLLTHPALLQQVTQEVDQHLDIDKLTPEMFMAMPTLHAAAMETLRMHTITLAQPRTVMREFTWHGHTFPQGAALMLSGSVSHFLPKFFAEPYQYDVTRYHAPRNEHRQKNAYAPYGIGAHLCLGAGVAETQFPLNIALLLKKFTLALQPENYKLALSNNPTPHPRGLSVKITGLR